MKKHDFIRIILVAASYLAFLPFSYFLYNGRNGIYFRAYENSIKLFKSVSVQQTILYTIFIGLGLSILIQIGLFFFTPEGKPEKRCALFDLPMSEALCVPYLLSYLISLLFILLLSHGKIGIAAVSITYLLLLALHILLLLLPSPKQIEIPDPVTAAQVAPDALTRYSTYLQKLTEKCESPALCSAMAELSRLLDTIDPALSDGIDGLEAKLSATCIEIENAIIGASGSKITLLTRELIDFSESVRSRIAAASLTVRGERFEETDNEIAEGLIDKILDEMDVEDEEEIVNRDCPLDTDLRFMKALRFADEGYRKILQGYNETIRTRLKQAQSEQKAHRMQFRKSFQKALYCSFVLFGIGLLTTFLIRAFVTQPDGFLYEKNSDGTLTILGYNQQYGEEVVIPAKIRGKTVREIGKSAFKNQQAITLVAVSEGIKIIGIDAFENAGSLKTVYLPASLTDVYGYAFNKDPNLSIHYALGEEEWENLHFELSGNTDTLKSASLTFNSKYGES